MVAEALPTTKKVEIIDKKEFVVVVLSLDNKIFVVYVTDLVEPTIISIYHFFYTQITLLKSKKTGIIAEYSEFSDVFFSNLAVKLLENTEINYHFINLLNNKQPLYGLIYSLRLVELEILKTYIKVNLANSFIKSFKFLTNILILFVQKKDNSFYFCIDY